MTLYGRHFPVKRTSCTLCYSLQCIYIIKLITCKCEIPYCFNVTLIYICLKIVIARILIFWKYYKVKKSKVKNKKSLLTLTKKMHFAYMLLCSWHLTLLNEISFFNYRHNSSLRCIQINNFIDWIIYLFILFFGNFVPMYHFIKTYEEWYFIL